MGKETKIEWCDLTFNRWTGCRKKSPGCKNCYADALWTRFGRDFNLRQLTGADNAKQIEIANRQAGDGNFVQCDVCGKREFRNRASTLNGGCTTLGCLAMPESESTPVRPRVFCGSMCDWLDPEVPIEWLADLLDLIRRTPHLDWLLLTKRPELWEERLDVVWHRFNSTYREQEDWDDLHAWVEGWLYGAESPENVWIGTSVEDQQRAAERIPELLKIPAKVRFLSVEPLLEHVDLDDLIVKHDGPGEWHVSCLETEGLGPDDDPDFLGATVNWVIVGGESGRGARACSMEWIHSIVRQCQAVNVPVFVKQLGARATTTNANLYEFPDGAILESYGEAAASARLMTQHAKGGDMAEWPEELQIREFPILK